MEGEKDLKSGQKGGASTRCRVWTRVDLPPAASTTSATTVTSTAVASTSAATVLGTTVAPSAAAVTAIAAASATLAEVTVTAATATSAAATTSTVATAAEAVLVSDGVKPTRNLLVRLTQELDEVADDVAVATVEERGSDTDVAGTASTTDTVDVVVDVRGQVVVDDVRDVRDIETTSSNGSSDKDGRATRTEGLQGRLTLALSAVTVNGRSREVVDQEEVGEHVGHALRLNEDEGEAGAVRLEDIEKDRALVLVLDVLDPLGDVLGGRADTTDGEEDVVLHEVSSEHLDVAGEGGGEHERLTLLNAGHVLALDDPTNLRLETHVEHAVGLIKDEVLHVGKADAPAFNQIDETARGSAEEVTSTLDLPQLLVDVGTAVDHSRPHPGAVAELASFIVDLADELTSRREDESGGVGLAATTVALSALRVNGGRARATGE